MSVVRTLPSPNRSTVHPLYRVMTGAVILLALGVIWTALASRDIWRYEASGYASLAFAGLSVVLVSATERCKPRLYELEALPPRNWPFTVTTYVNRLTGDVLGTGRRAKTIAVDDPATYNAWRDLRPTTTIMALGAVVLGCVVLFCTIPS